MREYELLYIVSGDQTEDQATKVTDAVNATLLKAGSKVESENVWGRRPLAYPVGNQKHGWYVVSRVSIDPTKMADIQNALNLEKDLLRVLLIKASEIPDEEEVARIEKAVKATEEEDKTEKDEAKATATEAVASKTTTKKAAPKAAAKQETEKKETATERKERQAKLEEKLGEILKEE